MLNVYNSNEINIHHEAITTIKAMYKYTTSKISSHLFYYNYYYCACVCVCARVCGRNTLTNP